MSREVNELTIEEQKNMIYQMLQDEEFTSLLDKLVEYSTMKCYTKHMTHIMLLARLDDVSWSDLQQDMERQYERAKEENEMVDRMRKAMEKAIGELFDGNVFMEFMT